MKRNAHRHGVHRDSPHPAAKPPSPRPAASRAYACPIPQSSHETTVMNASIRPRIILPLQGEFETARVSSRPGVLPPIACQVVPSAFTASGPRAFDRPDSLEGVHRRTHD